jgi:hypothetical protein
MATKIDAPHASPLITLDFLSSLSRAKLELLMTATTLICSIFLFVFFFALFKSGIVQKFGFLRSLGVDSFLLWCFFAGYHQYFCTVFGFGIQAGIYGYWIGTFGNFTFFLLTNSMILDFCTFE